MNPANKIFLVVASLALSAGAPASAQAGAQATGQAAGQTTVSADKTHAQASGGAAASSSAGASQANAGLASGTAFNAALNSSLDSKKSKPGDAVAAHTTENVKSQDKTTIIPKGTKLVGHVTKSSARAKGDAESELAIVFDRAILKNGEEVPLHVAIQAMAAVPTTASAHDRQCCRHRDGLRHGGKSRCVGGRRLDGGRRGWWREQHGSGGRGRG
jgi:type IV secretory pathway VirB10-like protein